MKKRLLVIVVLLFHIWTLCPIWSATETTTKPKKKTTVKKKATTKKKATKRKTTKSSTAKKRTADKNIQALSGEMGMLQEVWTRKITLDYLSDKRTEPYLAQILDGFSKKLQQNFLSNIKGDYKVEFIINYADKSEDVNNKIISIIKDQPKYDTVLSKLVTSQKFPMDLAYTDLIKKLSSLRKSQAIKNTKIAKWSEYWQNLSASMRKNAKKSRYESVAAIYEGVDPKDFPISWYDDAQYAVAFETEGGNPVAPGPQARKKWTILSYICADNDLERFGLQDINEMEQVGSSDKVNIVAQIDRMSGGHGDTISDGNWTGTRRYYVTKDNDLNKISSTMVENIGEQCMGSKETLADFIEWGVKTYPADNVVIVIWNHGGGWIGIAHDDHTDKMLSMTDVSWALTKGRKELVKANGKDAKFAVVDFDACLMGTIEVGYEISDSTQFLVASEENEPGGGMPYADYLGPLVKNPSLSARELTKRMVGTYVYSYAKGGSATNSVIKGSPVTKSAVDLSKLPALVKKFDELGQALLDNHEVYAELLVSEGGRFASIKRYSEETMVDLVDFAAQLSSIPNLPSSIRQTCMDIVKLVGYPVKNEKLAKPVIITSENPGSVIWGYNGWRTPPKELWPAGTRIYNSRLAITPLKKLQSGGYYAKIGPFMPVKDEALEKIVFVDEINYQIVLKDGRMLDKRRVKQGKEYLIVSKFPSKSPMVIEGHTQGMSYSHGLSIYFPQAYNFKNTYKSLKFAKDTCWDEFLETVPEFKRTADVILCGQMVQDPMTLPLVVQALKSNGVDFQILWDPSIFSFDFKSILSKFAKDGVVITDSVSANSMGQITPSSDDLRDYLNKGGRLMVAAQSFGKANIHRSLLKNYFKFTFVKEKRNFDELICKGGQGDFSMFLNGNESSRTASDVTVMKVGDGGKLFVTMPDGSGTAIYVSDEADSGKRYSAIYLGFRFEAIGDTEARNKLMGEVLDRLLPERHQLSLF